MEELEKHEGRSWIAILIVGIIIGSIVGGIFGTFIAFKNPTIFPWINTQITTQTQQGDTVTVPTDLIDIQNQIEEVADKVSPSVSKNCFHNRGNFTIFLPGNTTTGLRLWSYN